MTEYVKGFYTSYIIDRASMDDLTRKKLDNIAKELGSKVDYMTCYDPHSTWNKIVIEYNHKLKEKDTV